MRLDAAARTAAWVFVAGEAIGLAFYLWVGRGSWFNGDEWDFLTTRNAGSLHDLFSPHSQHWTTLPILAYRFWWQVIGIRSYTPYLASVVILHLTVAALLRAVMRRSGVSAWVATTAALIFVLFGSGYIDILYGFQIAFCGSLAFGLVYLLATSHDGPFDRRDLVGLVAGLASLMCSGVGAMVAVVVVATLIRRGWRMALACPAPRGHLPRLVRVVRPPRIPAGRVAGTDVPLRRDRRGEHLCRAGPRAGGGAPAGRAHGDRGGDGLEGRCARPRRQELAAPLALLAGAIVFAVVTGVGRGAPPAGVLAGRAGATPRRPCLSSR